MALRRNCFGNPWKICEQTMAIHRKSLEIHRNSQNICENQRKSLEFRRESTEICGAPMRIPGNKSKENQWEAAGIYRKSTNMYDFFTECMNIIENYCKSIKQMMKSCGPSTKINGNPSNRYEKTRQFIKNR